MCICVFKLIVNIFTIFQCVINYLKLPIANMAYLPSNDFDGCGGLVLLDAKLLSFFEVHLL